MGLGGPPRDQLAAQLSLVRGIGPWTVGSVLGPVCGDDDAVAVGDYHLPNIVAWNLAGERATTTACSTCSNRSAASAGACSACSASPGSGRRRSVPADESCRCTDGDDPS